ncbi:MAG: hypothetical protein JWM89_3121 [Acidimicrobiales bacterium]|nr:hypothetical protein [Acidimicrobiales bacterium]
MPAHIDPDHHGLAAVLAMGLATIALSGTVDQASGQALLNMAQVLIDAGATSFTLDMSNVTLLDCAGIAVILQLYSRAARHGGEVILHNPNRPIRRLLNATGLGTLVATP